MDIPETGAVFTLGKSYLSENHQSYFFIKNDPIKKLITGSNQSAVICESGRLFVWGENQFGQLATGSTEIVTKPSCVKVIKNLGYKVRNIAFGDAFSVILTENSKVFFNGKSIFTQNESFGNKLWNLGNGEFITRQNFEIVDFQKQCLDADGNLDDLVDVVAGGLHFVALTNSGKLFCYGLFDSIKTKKQKLQLGPRKISEHLVVRVAKCGSSFTTFVNDRNEIYLIGKFNNIEYPKATKLNTSALKDSIYSLYVSREDEIFLICSSGDVYKSTNEGEIHFERIILFNDNDVITKFCSGNGFVCVLTDKNKLLTTFNEKTSAKKIISIPPRELRKFQDLHILDIATGLQHILLFATSKSNIFTSLDQSSSDANENPSVKVTPAKVLPLGAVPPKTKIPPKTEIVEHLEKEISNESAGRIPILTKKTLEAIYTDTENTKSEKTTTASGTKAVKEIRPSAERIEKIRIETKHIEVEPSPSLKEFEKLEMENALETAVTHVGDSLKAEVKTIVASGKEQIDEIKDGVMKTAKEIPKNIVDYTKAEIVPKIDNQIKQVNETKNEILDDIFGEVKQSKDFLKQSLDRKLSHEMGGNDAKMEKMDKPPTSGQQLVNTKVFLRENQNEIDQMLRGERIKTELEKDERIEVLLDDTVHSTKTDDKVKFIDNGVDVSHTSTDIVQSMKDEIKEMDAEIDEKAMNIKQKYEDNFLGEKLGAKKEAFVDTMTKAKNDTKKAISNAMDSTLGKHIPLKYDLEEIDLDGDGDIDGDTERTTASIKSVSTPTKNPFDTDDNYEIESENMKNMATSGRTAMKESSNDGRVKRFLNEIKSNCKTADTVVEVEGTNPQYTKSHSMDDIIGDNKTSKVCTIL